jgi:hypothetical protein
MVRPARLFRTALVVAALVGAATTTVIASPAAAAITGRTQVWASTPNNLDSYKSAHAVCPTGMSGLGGGAFVVGGNDVVHITANGPMMVSQGHVAVAQAHPGYRDGVYVEATAWRLYAYAICAYGVTGREVVLAGGAITAGENAGARTLSCPAGKRVVGMGGYVAGPNFMLTSLDVAPDLTWVDMTWGRAADTVGGTSWAEVTAVCVDPIPGLQRVQTVSASSSNHKSVNVGCPSGKQLYDFGGGLNTGSHRYVAIDALLPSSTGGIAHVREMVYGYSSSWKAEATAICA